MNSVERYHRYKDRCYVENSPHRLWMVQKFAFHFWQKQTSKTTKRVEYSAEMNVRSSSLSIENLSSLVVLYICEWRNSPLFDAQSIVAICDNYANQQRLSLLRPCEWNAKRIAISVVSHVFGSLSWWVEDCNYEL